MIQVLKNHPVWASAMVVLAVAGPVGVAAAATLPDVSAHPPWTLTERIDGPEGYVLSRRDFPGSGFPAHRLEATIEASAATAAAAFRKNVADPNTSPKNMRTTVLREDEDVLVIYSYIEMPLFSDRDITTRIVASPDPETGNHRFDWQVTDEGPPPKDGVIRLQKSSGSWVFTPLAEGRTFAVHESHTEIEGAIPPWLVTSFIGEMVVDGLVLLRARLELDQKLMAAESAERPVGAFR